MCSLKSISVFQSCERGYSSVTPVTNLFLDYVTPYNPSVTPLITPLVTPLHNNWFQQHIATPQVKLCLVFDLFYLVKILFSNFVFINVIIKCIYTKNFHV